MNFQSDEQIPFLSSEQIRKGFIQFFEERAHKVVPSQTIAPTDDPTLLFTNSGMNQFKSIFLGDNRAGLTRVVDAQKCLRVSGKHNDLDEVGKDGRHHTFFEMLGNWSFGDYFKKEAIVWAWELLTKVWKLPKHRLFATVHKDDAEAFEIWQKETDIDPSHILKFTEDNFWEMGPTGPCGPCSEIVYDTGDLASQQKLHLDPVYGVNGKDDRFLEIWNLVFIQFERMADGSLRKLSKNHVDTGAGLERLCSVIQKCSNNYQSDVFSPLIQAVAKISGVPYADGEQGLVHRIIADHLRAISFAIADGVTPGNEGRGYVIRRILRRASRYAHLLGLKEPVLHRLVANLVEQMGKQYPELSQRQAYIAEVIRSEEVRFLQTLEQGLHLLEKLTKQLKKEGKTVLSGRDVFSLYDTYGFPVDLTQIVANENGLEVDEKGYQLAMEEQKERGRQFAKFDSTLSNDENWVILKPTRETSFLGYDALSAQVSTTRYREEASSIFICLDQTPFYAEAGGQVGDIGTLSNNELTLRVEDTFKAFDLIVHRCVLVQGLVSSATLTKLVAQVDVKSRFFTARHHSVTHLLHAALRQVLGDQVNQQGSYVGPDRLRFDFTCPRKLSDDELLKVEDLVNEQIQQNHPITTQVQKFDDAKKGGAMALFGEKYGETVRVLTMGSFSKELCGGTHAKATGEIGLFKIIAESSVAAGVRRIEALAAGPAFDKLRRDSQTLVDLATSLKTQAANVGQRVLDLQAQVKDLEKTLGDYRAKEQSQKVLKVLEQRQSTKDFSFIVKSLSATVTADELNGFVNELSARLDKDLVVLTSVAGQNLNITVLAGKAVKDRFPAQNLLKELCLECGGKGGGRADRAQAGSPHPEHETKVLNKAKELIAKFAN